MTSAEFLADLRARDVRIWVEEGRLKCDAPPGFLDAGLRAELAARKEELLALVVDAQAALRVPRSLVPLKPTGDFRPGVTIRTLYPATSWRWAVSIAIVG